MIETLDVTMTAVVRPGVIRRTLVSFKEGLFKEVPIRLIINIDPVGEGGKPENVIDVVKSIFPQAALLWRIPERPSFPKAFRWAWSHTDTPFIFHLEDDWELLKDVDLEDMIGLMEEIPTLAVLRLPYRPCTDMNKSWGYFLPWNGRFYEVPEEQKGLLGSSGHPSLIRREFVQIALKMLNEDKNPEKSIKWKPGVGYGKLLQEFKYGAYGKPGEEAAVKDIGSGWAAEHGWRKKGQKANFTVWEKCDVGGKRFRHRAVGQ